jgi:glycosyltransferase involved in cell wall biosynthesis
VTVSEATKRAVLKEAPWFPVDKITVIPTVVPQHFKPRKERPENPKPLALQIGLAENKNLKRHAQALEGLNVHLKIIGEPSPQDVAILERHSIDFSWQSKLTDEEMQEAYGTSDFLLFASTLEGFGMPIIEAQMVGLPVITSDVDPMREVAGDGALLCDPMDANSIRTRIEEVTGNREKREALIQRGFVNCHRYAPATSAAMLRALYERLLNP